MTETFDELVGFRQIAGDIVIYDKDVESHLVHVRQFLQRFQEQISLNKDKRAFC